ncbi:hypothetical protein ACRARG_15600 [Pseudooceanicola sp. C21-150M6]|uniref:hypothetical protein n=1 Tax=Pseudooceanicola sp. C21-150M6 TaxID=3434355 RepID=UPI003D7F8174
MDRHIVIAGQGRAGSTLFYEMMRHALAGFEMPAKETRALSIIDRPGNFCTKRPFDIFDIEKVLEAAGTQKRVDLIVTLRDPRDILTSRHARLQGDYFYAADKCYRILPDREPEFIMPGFLPVHQRIVEVLQTDLFPQGVFLLKYEHLVEDPDRIQGILAQALDLEFTDSFVNFHENQVASENQSAMNGLRALDRSRQAKWRAPEHRERIIDQFTRFPDLHDIVIGLGYEDDRSWFDEIVAEKPVRAAAG